MEGGQFDTGMKMGFKAVDDEAAQDGLDAAHGHDQQDGDYHDHERSGARNPLQPCVLARSSHSSLCRLHLLMQKSLRSARLGMEGCRCPFWNRAALVDGEAQVKGLVVSPFGVHPPAKSWRNPMVIRNPDSGGAAGERRLAARSHLLRRWKVRASWLCHRKSPWAK